MKRFAIAVIASLATSCAAAGPLTFEEPQTLVSAATPGCGPCSESWVIEGFRISGHIYDFGPYLYYPYSYSTAYGGRMLASPSRALLVPRQSDGGTSIERTDG